MMLSAQALSQLMQKHEEQKQQQMQEQMQAHMQMQMQEQEQMQMKQMQQQASVESIDLSHASSLSSVITMDNDEEQNSTQMQRGKDSGVFCYSSTESDLSGIIPPPPHAPLKQKMSLEEHRLYLGSLRSRRVSAVPGVPALPVIHDNEIPVDYKRHRSGSLGEIALGDANSFGRRCSGSGSGQVSESASSSQSQLPTIHQSVVLPSQPINGTASTLLPSTLLMPRPLSHFARRYSSAVRPTYHDSQESMAAKVITVEDVYASLPCRSHQKRLNLHSKAQDKAHCQKCEANCPGPIVSPLMQLYMESSSPAIQEYVQQILKLNNNSELNDEQDKSSCPCSQRTSTVSLPQNPAWQPAKPLGIHRQKSSDPAIITVDDVDHDTDSLGMPSELPVVNIIDDNLTLPLKITVQKIAHRFRLNAVRDALCSVLRNAACYLLLVAIILIIVHGGLNFNTLPLWQNVVPLVFLCLSFIGIPLQLVHALKEIRRPEKRTIIAQMLCTKTKRHTDFINMINKRLTNAPYVAVEVKSKPRRPSVISRLSSLSGDSNSDGTHHPSRSRTILKELAYKQWSDQSKFIEECDWAHARYNWIIVAKDYQSSNQATDTSLQNDIEHFCHHDDIDTSNEVREAKSKMILDVMEGEAYPDVQAYLVCPDEGKSRFYTFSVYKVMLCMGLDALYSIAFHIVTRHVGQYNIVKVIER